MAIETTSKPDWRRRISNNIAAALILAALLHLIVTMAVASETGNGWLNLLGLALLGGAVVPFLTWFETRWLNRVAHGDPTLWHGRFVQEFLALWAAAVLAPLCWGALLYLILRH